jgi:CubicO group peptidase (beta-lactamase class C family)
VPDKDIIYTLASCTKGFTGTAIGLLAYQGKINLDEKVTRYLPSFHTKNSPAVSQEMTVKDLLSHCSGLSPLPYEVIGKNGSVFARRENVIQICNNLPHESDFRSEWKYNNWMFALAGVLIQQVSQRTFGQLVQHEVFDPLSMTRTATENPKADDNYARPYLAFSDGSSDPVQLPSLSDGWAFDASGSVRSSVSDTLTWAKALMNARRTSFDDYKEVSTPHSHPFSWLSGCFKSRQPRPPHPLDEKVPNQSTLPQSLVHALRAAQTPHFPLATDPNQAYALGLFTFQLPTTGMNLVTNTDVITTPYRIGATSPPLTVVGHTGELGGFLSAYWTLPEEDSAVVVFCNSFQLNGDPTNIVAQLLIQTLFNLQPQVDFLSVATEIVTNAKARWNTLVHEWTAHRIQGTAPGEAQRYAGTYTNAGLAMSLEVVAEGSSKLRLRINDNEEQTFELYHYHRDTWTFLPASRDEVIRQGYSSYLYSWQAFLIGFTDVADNHFQSIRWKLDFDQGVEKQVFGFSAK